jgi:nucleotide-binding universal stress UspA family protein
MQMKILLCVDTELSPATQRALLTACNLIEQASPHFSLLLLTVIPITQIATTHPGVYVGQMMPNNAPTWQKTQAEEVLNKARQMIQQHGLPLDNVQVIVRVGTTAEEIAKVAQDQRVNLVVLGSRGESWRQKMRRFFIGSTSRRVLQLSPCPVLIVVPPRAAVLTSDLVSWYENAITLYLREHGGSLAVFTPDKVAHQFASFDKAIGELEIQAATQALERLACSGTLCRHQVADGVRYVND